MRMKKINIILVALIAGLTACTAVQPLDYTPAAKERPADYLENLLAFKAKKTHKVSVAMIATTAEAPTRANQHLTAYPDSLDYIAIVGDKPLHSTIAEEMASVRNLGTKVLHMVDYGMAWDAWFAEHLELEEGFLQVLKTYTDNQLASLDAYPYDGIIISYTGKTVTDIEASAQKQFMDECLGWVKQHEGKTVLFRGYARNLTDNSFLKNCEYLIVVPGTNASVGELTVAVNAQLVTGVPKDRIMVEISIPEPVDGEWVGPTGAQGAAWIKDFTAGVGKKGLAFYNAQYDYYHPDGIFPEIRTGINKSNE